MRRRRLTAAAITSLLAFTGVVATASAGHAGSGGVCNTVLGYYATQVPIRSDPYAAPGSDPTDCYMSLYTGSKVAVRALQDSLYGCYRLPVALDGSFGPKTQAALKLVQTTLGIEADGIYGNQSRDHMRFLVRWEGANAICAPAR